MTESKNALKNTVSSANQLDREKYVSVYERGGKLRVLFLGNSITRHAPKADIGWSGDWGMAASKIDKDYVHLVVKALDEKYGTVDYCIAQGASWERDYVNTEKVLEQYYTAARDFAADIVIIRIGENVPASCHLQSSMKEPLRTFTKYLAHSARLVVMTDLFWTGAKNAVFGEVAAEEGYTFVKISDLELDEENMAIGLFEHEGVAHHPGDLGMSRIAQRIIDSISL